MIAFVTRMEHAIAANIKTFLILELTTVKLRGTHKLEGRAYSPIIDEVCTEFWTHIPWVVRKRRSGHGCL
jgi:hypothetical protein